MRVGETFDRIQIGPQADSENSVVIGAGNLQQMLVRRRTGIVQGLTVGERNQVVIFGMDDQRRFGKRPNLVQLPEPLGFLETGQNSRVDADPAQQRSRMSEGAFKDKSSDLAGMAPGQFQC
ncbi:MAG: hypothetical protein H6R23_2715 [Proteobacteria bacterium]|nr:hypothetical protein [Pseudomonadota bacterium]